MNFYGMSSIGMVRGNNEDFFHTPFDREQVPFFVVADGMGGANAGEIASALAVADAVNFVTDNLSGTEDKSLLLRRAVGAANLAVYNTSKVHPAYSHMGTTLVCALLCGERVYIANVGDSRCYLYSQGSVEQVTVDHSFVQEMIDNGLLTAEEARVHPNRNLITRAIGIERFVPVDVFTKPWGPGDKLLLASDGLTGMLEPDVIKEELAKDGTCTEIVHNLVERANLAGGNDNITAVLIAN